jgi:hypothetical protein
VTNRAWRNLWFYGAIAVCLLLLAGTLTSNRQLNLRRESNFAAMWSGMLLLLVALHAFDGWALNKAVRPAVARAWLVISLVLVSLSFDEIGSLHERLPSETHLTYWLYILPFALAYACLSVYALCVLYRSDDYRWNALLICAAFVLFGTVAIQEEIEWRLSLPSHLKPIRGAIEEGTELLGMILLLKATMANTRGLLSRVGPSTFPTLEAVRAWRSPGLWIGLVGAPLVAWGTVNLPPDRWGHGIPANWPPTAVFLLAAFCAIRPFLDGTGGVRWTGWALAAVCLVGCTQMILRIDSPKELPVLGLIAGAAAVLWIVDSRYAFRAYLPAVVFLFAVLGAAWQFSHSELALYGAVLWVALAVYFVNSAPLVVEGGSVEPRELPARPLRHRTPERSTA